jgi:hypothetical protein
LVKGVKHTLQSLSNAKTILAKPVIASYFTGFHSSEMQLKTNKRERCLLKQTLPTFDQMS